MGDKGKEMRQAEKIDRIFYAIFGMNGDDGLLKRSSKTESKVDALFNKWDTFIASRANTCPRYNKNRETRNRVIAYVLQAAAWATLLTKMIGWW